jgi:hypothetical protein
MGSNTVLHRVDNSGTTHTFRFQRGLALITGLSSLFLGVITAVAFAAGTSGRDTKSRLQLAALAGLICIPLVWLGIGSIRLGVIVRGRKLTIRNPWRTYTVDVSEIREITLERKANPNGVASLLPRVHLTSGRSIWLYSCNCGPAGQPPEPELISALAELCALIGIDPPCAASQPARHDSAGGSRRPGAHRRSGR